MSVGRILAAWGLRGDVKVEPLGPDSLWAPGQRLLIRSESHTIEHARRSGRFLYLKLAHVGRDEAERLRDATLDIPRDELPSLAEGEYYQFQLVGLAVRTDDGRDLGRIEEILPTAAHDVYVIRGPLGEVLVPAVEDFVLDVDLAAGVVTVEAVPGLLPD